jgi:hypothetical protein
MANDIQKGAANELLAAADLLRRGFDVFRNVAPSGCDLVIVRGHFVWRVEVAAATIRRDGQLGYAVSMRHRGDPAHFDVLAWVQPDGKILYESDIVELESLRY